MKRCSHCAHLDNGICGQFGKAPPSLEFAIRCKHHEFDKTTVIAPERRCIDCDRYDRDNLGEWCLFAAESDCITFKPLPFTKGESCPLT